MPITVRPTPACARAVPQAERGRPAARPNATAKALPSPPRARHDLVDRPEQQKGAEPDAERRRSGPPRVVPSRIDVTAIEIASASEEALRRTQKVAPLPGERLAERHQQQQRNDERARR